MGAMQSEVHATFRAIDIPEDRASKAAAALSARDDVSSIEAEPNVIKWMMGFALAFQAAIFTELFLHRTTGP